MRYRWHSVVLSSSSSVGTHAGSGAQAREWSTPNTSYRHRVRARAGPGDRTSVGAPATLGAPVHASGTTNQTCKGGHREMETHKIRMVEPPEDLYFTSLPLTFFSAIIFNTSSLVPGKEGQGTKNKTGAVMATEQGSDIEAWTIVEVVDEELEAELYDSGASCHMSNSPHTSLSLLIL
ncbi:hypothetical protein EDB87DRAFT_1578368 [Lactarius vividus]|nr:hypothetical protein EDB87DRAFT_1578368 [Lactarius vividus]